ncbi:hypothetical protein [Microbacterium panaciterrae]|uniref:Uncharacterized protein n=1 Tax=Microbacterium panaciterrae TaxID=985759 RepID=A0ABP8PQZ6_9MICO
MGTADDRALPIEREPPIGVISKHRRSVPGVQRFAFSAPSIADELSVASHGFEVLTIRDLSFVTQAVSDSPLLQNQKVIVNV